MPGAPHKRLPSVRQDRLSDRFGAKRVEHNRGTRVLAQYIGRENRHQHIVPDQSTALIHDPDPIAVGVIGKSDVRLAPKHLKPYPVEYAFLSWVGDSERKTRVNLGVKLKHLATGLSQKIRS